MPGFSELCKVRMFRRDYSVELLSGILAHWLVLKIAPVLLLAGMGVELWAQPQHQI